MTKMNLDEPFSNLPVLLVIFFYLTLKLKILKKKTKTVYIDI